MTRLTPAVDGAIPAIPHTKQMLRLSLAEDTGTRRHTLVGTELHLQLANGGIQADQRLLAGFGLNDRVRRYLPDMIRKEEETKP